MGWKENQALDKMNEIRISSAFPYLDKQYYFPKPFSQFPEINQVEPYRRSKILKKIKYIEEKIFLELISGNLKKVETNQISKNGLYLGGTEPGKHALKQLIERATIDRISHEATPFVSEALHFFPDAGLYFLVEHPDQSSPTWLRDALFVLSDQGLGAYRKSGLGQFELLEVEPYTLFESLVYTSDYYLSLSPVFPSKELINKMQSNENDLVASWKINVSEGYISSHSNENYNNQLRKMNSFLMEGSIIDKGDLIIDQLGEIKNLSPSKDFSIFRDGRGFWLPFKQL